MRKHAPTEPVDDGDEIDEAARHRDVGDVGRPDLVQPLDRHARQPVRVDLVAGRGFAGVRTAIERLDSYALHQGRDMPAADRNALAAQKIAQHTGARERALQMQFVDPPHDAQVFGRDGTRLVIDRASADVQNLRLAGNREIVRPVDHRLALINPALLSAPSKKSFSSASSPIFA